MITVSSLFSQGCSLKETENILCGSIELQKHEWKFERTRNAVRTQATRQGYLFCSHDLVACGIFIF